MLENIDFGRKSIFDVDIFTAMRLTCNECYCYPTFVIYNCSTHCLKQASSFVTDTEKEINDNALQSREQDASVHGLQCTVAVLSDLLNQEDKTDVVQEINSDILVQKVAGLSKPIKP